MDIPTQRRCLIGLAAMLSVGAVGAVRWSLSDLGREAGQVAVGSFPPIAVPSKDVVDLPPLDPGIISRSLRGPLYDPPPAPRAPVVASPALAPTPKPSRPASPPSLNLTLVGTIIDANQRVAILSDASGKFDIKQVGESLELSPRGVTIDTIESERVTLTYQGRQSTIQLDRSAAGGNPDPGERPGQQRRRIR